MSNFELRHIFAAIAMSVIAALGTKQSHSANTGTQEVQREHASAGFLGAASSGQMEYEGNHAGDRTGW